ncbi:MAG: Crp/Fnr family transcriptional regulator [Oxalobacteraceae bacterium]|nr:MAG: Crp/Fnr family transcriptional regulator [Oxalobacteraceae bacterium]
MSTAFLKKLTSPGSPGEDLSESDRALLLALSDDVQTFPARRDIVREDERPEHVLLMIEGWAIRYKVVEKGGRQITAFLMPGDFCDTHVTMFDQMDHTIASLNETKIALVPRAKILELLDRPALARSLWWASLIDEAILRAWIVNLGRRDAYDRVGHLFCELSQRLDTVGLVSDGQFALPLTQEDLADAVGLTSVHVNRILKQFRDDGLLTFRHQHVTIADPERLSQAIGFDANYLHLPSKKPHLN